MSNTPKISILVPVYNVEQYIERCAQSLFEQTYSDLEYLFVNDCSPDKSIEVLQHVMKKYPNRSNSVKIINHNTHRGVAAARNTLLDNATGDFVSCVDADDWLELNAIEIMVQIQSKTNADIVSGNALMYYTDRVEKLEHPRNINKEKNVLDRLGNGWHNVIWGRLIRRSVIEDNNVRTLEECDMAEDKYQMAQLTYFSDTFAVCDDIVYNYERRNDNSIVAQQSKDKVLKKGLQFLRNNIGLQNFFMDKETVFYEEASKQTMLYALNVLKMMVRYNDKRYFQFVVETIDDTDSKFWPLIDWTTKGIIGRMRHNYFFVWMWLTQKRLWRFVKRKLSN